MAASGTVNDKLNVLVYFEAIILNSNVANRLINSAFMNLLTKLLKNVKSPHLKLRLCSILGQLVRHSTVIGNEVAESGLAQLLSEVVSDKNEKVRRKAVASLGEFMFYAATQLDDEQADPVWNLAPVAIKSLVKCLNQGEDEVVRFYACKTIENITAQSISAGCNFATLEVATLLLNIYHTVTMDSFRTSAAVSVSHICKLNTTLFPTIFESITCKQFSQALLDGSQRIQQAFLTMINIALTQPYPKLNDTLQEDDTFQSAISQLLENQSIVLRGKAILTFLLLFKMNPQWMIIAVEQDFYKNIDKLLRDNYKYVQCCLLCLIETVSTTQIPNALASTKESFGKFM
jgi:serine/threonine-protein kinase ULK4|tara:strand:+ start:375 stop:1412 length:1038 start_codon:yes stop_codon:yes gene_type:complete